MLDPINDQERQTNNTGAEGQERLQKGFKGAFRRTLDKAIRRVDMSPATAFAVNRILDTALHGKHNETPKEQEKVLVPPHATIPTQAKINTAEGRVPSHENPDLKANQTGVQGQERLQEGSDKDGVTSDLGRAPDAAPLQKNKEIPKEQAQKIPEEQAQSESSPATIPITEYPIPEDIDNTGDRVFSLEELGLTAKEAGETEAQRRKRLQVGFDKDGVMRAFFRRTPDAAPLQENNEIPEEQAQEIPQAQIKPEKVIGDPAQEVIQEKGLNPEQSEEYEYLNSLLKGLLEQGLEYPVDACTYLGWDLRNDIEWKTNAIGSYIDDINQMCSRINDLLKQIDREEMGREDMVYEIRSFQSSLSNLYENLKLNIDELFTNLPDSPKLRETLSNISGNLQALVNYNEKTKINVQVPDESEEYGQVPDESEEYGQVPDKSEEDGQVPDESEQEREIRRSEEMLDQIYQARQETHQLLYLCDKNLDFHRRIRNIISALEDNVDHSNAYYIIKRLTDNPELGYLADRLLDSFDEFKSKLAGLSYQIDLASEVVYDLQYKYTEFDRLRTPDLERYLREYIKLAQETIESRT